MNTTESTSVDANKAGVLAQQLVALLQNEPAETRRRAVAAAMMLMGDVSMAPTHPPKPDPTVDGGPDADMASFFDREGDLKPADYAHLSAAFFYSVYGPVSFSIDEIRTISADAGIVLPDRLDMTFAAATRKGKKLYHAVGKGEFKATAAGGVFFKEQWGVKPGRKVKGVVGVEISKANVM